MIYNITFGVIFLACAIGLVVQGLSRGWTTVGVLWLFVTTAGFIEKVFRVAQIHRERRRPPRARAIDMPCRMSPEVQRLAGDVRTRIAAIKLYREENPGISLSEAKAEIEAFARTIH